MVFFKKRFKFQPNICNGCHDSLMMLTTLSDIAILTLKVLIIVALLAVSATVRS